MQIVTAEDYEQHMAAIGQAQAAAELTRFVLKSVGLARNARVVIAGAGTGQMLDYLDAELLRPYHLTFTDLNFAFLARLRNRLDRYGLGAAILVDDIETSALAPGPGLLMAALLLEHIDWRRGVEAFAALRPAACAIILQQNPPDMDSAVTPGRRLPRSMAIAMESAHPALVPVDDLVKAFADRGYECGEQQSLPVADGKRLTALLFTRRPAASAVE